MSDERKSFLKNLEINSSTPTYAQDKHYSKTTTQVIARHPNYSITHTSLTPVQMEETSENIVVISPLSPWRYAGFFIAYPTNEEHADLFSRSQTQRQGPNDLFPGSIAVLNYICHNLDDKKFSFNFLQHSFRQGSPKQITRSLATNYMGARKRLIEQAIIYANTMDNPTLDLEHDFLRSPHNPATLENVLDEMQLQFPINKNKVNF